MLRQLFLFPKRVFVWAIAGWLPIFTVTLNSLAICFAAALPPISGHESIIRIVATTLQAVGWSGVFYGVLTTRKQFGMPSIWQNIRNWWGQFPMLFPKPIKGNAHIVLDGLSASGVGTVGTPSIVPNTLENKVDYLMAEVQKLHETHKAISKKNTDKFSELNSALASLNSSHTEEIENVKKTLNSHATGGIDLTLSGSVFFFVGTVLGTLPYTVIRLPYETYFALANLSSLAGAG